MSGESSYFKLGLFLLVGLAVLVVGIVLLGAGSLFQDVVILETATTESVEGLDVGAQVKFKGVLVGKVSRIEMAMWRYPSAVPEQRLELSRYIVIEMQVRRDMLQAKSKEEIQKNLAAAIATGMRVRMSSSGLTGPALLEVAYLDPAAAPVPTLPYTPEHIYMPSAPSVMSQMVSGVEGILAEIKKMELAKVVDNINQLIVHTDTAVVDLKTQALRQQALALLEETNGAVKRVRGILDHPGIDRTLTDLSATMATVKDTAQGSEFKAFVADLPKISGRVRTSMDRVDEILRDPKLQQTLDNLRDTTAAAPAAAADLRRALKEINLILSGEQANISAIVANLRRVLENSAALTEDAKNNPARVLFGAPPPRGQMGGGK